VLTGSEDEDVVAAVVVADPAQLAMADRRVLAGSCPVTVADGTVVVAVAAARPGEGQVKLESDGQVVAGPAESLVMLLAQPAAFGPLVARLDGDDGPGSTTSIRTPVQR